MHSPILQPVAILAGWTMFIWLWMYATRIPAMKKAGLDAAKMVGGKGSDLDAHLPDKVQWKAHNFNHLLADPTIFYAIAIVLAMIDKGDGINNILAWAYVGFRIAHSLVQTLWNRVMVRFALYALSTLCLISLVTHAILYLF